MTVWVDAVARARGLGTRLLTGRQLEALAEAAPAEMGTALARAGYPTAGGATSAASLEAAVRRETGRRMTLLARWLGRRTELLAVAFEAEDLRAIRRLLRGAAQGAAPRARLSGLLPTPRLPERLLEELARSPDPPDVMVRLAAAGHPLAEGRNRGTRSTEDSDEGPTDLLGLELRLARAFAARAAASAARGGSDLRTYVSRTIDLENAWTVLVAVPSREVAWEEAFLAGGALLTRDVFRKGLRASDAAEALAVLRRAFAGSRLAPAFAGEASGLEERTLAALLSGQRAVAALRPLGPAPILVYLLRLRTEVLALRRILWGRALGAPPRLLTAGLPELA